MGGRGGCKWEMWESVTAVVSWSGAGQRLGARGPGCYFSLISPPPHPPSSRLCPHLEVVRPLQALTARQGQGGE